MKICWLDTETTGLSAYKNDVIQIGMLIEIDGVIRAEHLFHCQPHDPSGVSEEALEVHGMGMEELMSFPKPNNVFCKFKLVMDEWIDCYNKKDKFIMAGYNVGFDFNMMQQWWKKAGGEFWGSYFEYKQFDVYPLAFLYANKYNWDVPNHKLETMPPFLGIPLQAHDALGDIKATREVYKKLEGALPKEWEI